MVETSVAGLTARSGERVTGVAKVQLGDWLVEVPIILVQGVDDGPRVAVTAGIHGAEYVGIEAARRVGMSVDPHELGGTLVVVPVANTSAFFTRSIYTSGLTGENLNRLFPGDPSGSPAQMLADWLFQHIIRPSEYYIDMHGGDMIEALVPFVLSPQTGDSDLDRASHGMAVATGIERVIASDVAGSTVGAAVAAGIPSILAEIGGQGVWREDEVAAHMESTLRVLRHLGLLTGETLPGPHQRTYHTFAWMRSEFNGFFHPTVHVGAHVQQGQHLGSGVDYFGNQLQMVEAVTGGEVVFLVTSLAMNAGDPLLAIGS